MSETDTNQVDETKDGAPEGAEPAQAAQPVEGEVEVMQAAGEADGEPGVVAEAEPEQSREQELEAELAKVRDQLLRTAADFENYRRRARKDVEDAQRGGVERALLEVLPVADNLERALGAVDGATDVNGIVEGVNMVLNSFGDALERLGVERVPAKGQPFDPNVHEAIQQVPTAEHTPGTVVSELMPGYRLGPKLLRAAMVAVAKAPPADESGGESTSN